MNVSMCFTTFYWVTAPCITLCTYFQSGTKVFSQKPTDGEAILRAVEKYKITSITLAPFNTYFLTNQNVKEFDISSLKYMLIVGTPIGNLQLETLWSVFKPTKAVIAYGMSELGLVSVFDSTSTIDFLRSKSSSVGKINFNTSLKIVDYARGELLEPQKTGEICIRTSSIFVKYYNQLCNDCFDNDDFFKTGDLGYYDSDGYLYITGRIKEMFKYKYWHIIPALLEAILIEHPDVEECVVYGTPAGKDGDVSTAAVVLKNTAKTIVFNLEQYVAEKVIDRERLRGGVKIVKFLPKTASGKISRADIQNKIENILIGN